MLFVPIKVQNGQRGKTIKADHMTQVVNTGVAKLLFTFPNELENQPSGSLNSRPDLI